MSYGQMAVVMLFIVQRKSLGVMLKLKPSTVSLLLHVIVKFESPKLTCVTSGGRGGAGGRNILTRADSASQHGSIYTGRGKQL